MAIYLEPNHFRLFQLSPTNQQVIRNQSTTMSSQYFDPSQCGSGGFESNQYSCGEVNNGCGGFQNRQSRVQCGAPCGQQLLSQWEDQRREIVVLKNKLKQTEDVVRCELQISDKKRRNMECGWAQEKQCLIQERNDLKRDLCCLMDGAKNKFEEMEANHRFQLAQLQSQQLQEQRQIQMEIEQNKNQLKSLHCNMANVLQQAKVMKQSC